MVPVIRDAGRLTFPQFLDALQRPDRPRARQQAHRRRPPGRQHLAHQPGRHRHDRLGAAADDRARARSSPPARSATRPASARSARTIGAEKVMTMTSTYDHRVIQGAESGQFLQVVEAYLQGEHGFYEQVFARPRRRARRGARRPPRRPPGAGRGGRPPRRRRRAAGAVAPDEALLQAVQAATSLIKAHRTHGHLAARLDPLGSEPEGDPALDPEPLGLTPELMAQDPGARSCASASPGETLADALPHLRETYCGTIAYEIEHIASHRQRVWLREKIETGAFRQPLDRRGEEGAAAPPDAGRLARALHAQGLPGPEAVLDRGPGHDGPDARRDDPALGRRTARARS